LRHPRTERENSSGQAAGILRVCKSLLGSDKRETPPDKPGASFSFILLLHFQVEFTRHK
jgi:hypothetical protein